MNISEKILELENEGIINHGTILKKSQIEKIIGVSYESENESWFKFRTMDIKLEIEKLGYFCTQSKCDPCEIRILPSDIAKKEYARREKRANRLEKRIISTTLNYQSENLDKKEKIEIEHIKEKAIMRQYSLDSILRRRKKNNH